MVERLRYGMYLTVTDGVHMVEQIELFGEATDGYHTFRIPAMVTTRDDTVLAFCEGRVHGRGDAGEIHILLKRSHDNGLTWGPTQVIVSDAGMTCGNPSPVVDRGTGHVWLLFCKNDGDKGEATICRGQAPRTVRLTGSADDGQTWTEPREITADVKKPDWTWYATGPGHSIQLASGRLLAPCDHIVGRDFDQRTDPYHSHVIFSDDQGASWRIGGIVGEGTNECMLVELDDGTVYLNARNYRGAKRRAVARSTDAGESFGDLTWDEALVEPICQASIVRHPTGPVLFANPASTKRERLTVRASLDGCRTWNAGLVLHDGPAAYSDLAVAADGTVLCLYERGTGGPYERLSLARLDLDEILGA